MRRSVFVFAEQSVESLVRAIDEFEAREASFDPHAIRRPCRTLLDRHLSNSLHGPLEDWLETVQSFRRKSVLEAGVNNVNGKGTCLVLELVCKISCGGGKPA